MNCFFKNISILSFVMPVYVFYPDFAKGVFGTNSSLIIFFQSCWIITGYFVIFFQLGNLEDILPTCKCLQHFCNSGILRPYFLNIFLTLFNTLSCGCSIDCYFLKARKNYDLKCLGKDCQITFFQFLCTVSVVFYTLLAWC